MIKAIVAFCACLIIALNSYALELRDFKFRARESYDIYSIKLKDSEYSYKGLSNTVSWGLEKKKEYYYALFINPLLASDAKLKDDSSPFGEKARLVSFGLEAKQFFKETGLIFFRGSLAWSQLVSENMSAKSGYSVYGGVGYEFFITPSVAIAPEWGYRFSDLSDDVSARVQMFSLGVHFYHF